LYINILVIIDCNESRTNDCPPNYYCNLKNCMPCHGTCASCVDRDVCTKCSRFTKQWKTPFTINSSPPLCDRNIY